MFGLSYKFCRLDKEEEEEEVKYENSVQKGKNYAAGS